MAASPAFPGHKRAVLATEQALQAPVVRTEVHTMPAGVGTRSFRRRITPEAGYALEILGHAIEYLADEYAHETGRTPQLGAGCIEPQVEAMQILMAANRQVYFECPVITPLYQRILKRLLPH
jgi:hypothetical protein